MYEVIHLNETVATKLSHSYCEDLTQRSKTNLTQVTPDTSRIDSSNLNPLDFLNCGVQFISMNYQVSSVLTRIKRTNLIYSLDSDERTNNGHLPWLVPPEWRLWLCHETILLDRQECHVQCEKEGYDARSVRFCIQFELIDVSPPGIDPVNIRIKIISGQQLPRPKGASLKANSIDPYVTVQCLGVPFDCAEARTRTVSNDGDNPLFDESFELNVNVPELAVIRFLVLDDDFINDDFIGQLTVPVSTMSPGYKHVRLQNLNGEVIPNATLFVKVSITNRLVRLWSKFT